MLLAELAVGLAVVERDRHVVHALEQALEDLVVGLAPRVAADRLARDLAELVVGLLAAGRADQVEALGQRALVGEVVERGQQLARGEVARRAEDDHRRRRDREPLQPLDKRVVADLLGRGVGGDRRPASRSLPRRRARPRGRRTGCAARPAPCACTRPPCASRSARTARPRSPASGRRGRSRRPASSGPRRSPRRCRPAPRGRCPPRWNAFSASSSSHERTTEPRFQSPQTSSSSIGKRDLCMTSKPSA